MRDTCRFCSEHVLHSTSNCCETHFPLHSLFKTFLGEAASNKRLIIVRVSFHTGLTPCRLCGRTRSGRQVGVLWTALPLDNMKRTWISGFYGSFLERTRMVGPMVVPQPQPLPEGVLLAKLRQRIKSLSRDLGFTFQKMKQTYDNKSILYVVQMQIVCVLLLCNYVMQCNVMQRNVMPRSVI